MKIGFRSPYQKTETTYLTLHLARIARDLGFDVEFLPQAGKPAQVHSFWDQYVVRDPKTTLPDWIESGLAYLVYTSIPLVDELHIARKRGIRTMLLAIWNELEESEIDKLKEFDFVVCPSKPVSKLLVSRLHLNNVHYVPWVADLPITKDHRETDPKRIGVIWPLDGVQAERQETDFLPMISMLLECCPEAWLTVTYSNTLSNNVVKELRKIVQYADGRCELFKNLHTDKQELLFGHHDITVWPTLIESCGLTGLSSLMMGTPIIAFDHPVIGEFCHDDKNSVLVPCDITTNNVGVPFIKADYPMFGRYMVDLVKDIPKLSRLRDNATLGFKDRRDDFNSRWKKLLSMAD